MSILQTAKTVIKLMQEIMLQVRVFVASSAQMTIHGMHKYG